MLTVDAILSPEYITVVPECPVDRARWLMRERKLRHALVLEHGRLIGIASERDLLERALPARKRATPERIPEVRDRMSVSLETLTADEPVGAACERMLARRISCLPVMRDGRLVGVVGELELLALYVCVCRFAGLPPRIDPQVEECMSRDVATTTPDSTVSDALELCRARSIRHLPVLQDGWVVGIVSDHDLLPVIGLLQGETRLVADVMTKDFVAVVPGTPLSEAAECMLQNGFHALPVLSEGGLQGIVTSVDALEALRAVDEATLEAAWEEQHGLETRSERP